MKPFSQAVLDWFAREARDLPWREGGPGGLRRDPYRVLVSEFMLQQTQVTTVIPYYHRFLENFPDLASLARAEEEEVLNLWEGLGYYRRARQLWLLARTLIRDFGGDLPRDRKSLMQLPGIGPYSAGAILAFAFNQAEPAVDGNVVRLFARLEAAPYLPGQARSQKDVARKVRDLIPQEGAGDFVEALIELGATLCKPRQPACQACPVLSFCKAKKEGRVEDYPAKAAKKEKPLSKLTYVLIREGEGVYCRLREGGLLSGLYEFFPLVGLIGEGEEDRLLAGLDQAAGLKNRVLEVRFRGEGKSVFSHRVWTMAYWELVLSPEASFLLGEGGRSLADQGFSLVPLDRLDRVPLPVFLASWRQDYLASSCE